LFTDQVPRRRVLRVALVAAALSAAVLATAADGRPGRHACSGGRTITRTPTARVYARHARFGTGAWGCLYATGRPVLLGTWRLDRDNTVERITLAGPYAAFDDLELDTHGDGSDDVKALDLRSGRTVHHRQFEMLPDEGVQERVIGLKLTRAGSIAWTVDHRTDSSGQSLVDEQVWKADRTRGGQLLDSGPTLDPRSLRLEDHRIFWRVAQSTRSAPIR
jgi:hypothetical protein